MYRIDTDGTITMIRGDTAEFDIQLTDSDGEPYELLENDSLIFTVKKNTKSDETLIQKTGDHVVIDPEDTSDLKYGTYVYDVQFTSSSGKVDTVIPPSKFILKDEVTW